MAGLPPIPELYDSQSEEVLSQERNLVKKLIKQGTEPIPEYWKVWVVIEGRTKQGEIFQKPNETNYCKGDLLCLMLDLGISSMKKGEVCWIKAPSGTHDGWTKVQDEEAWFRIYLKEYLDDRLMQVINEKLKVLANLSTFERLSDAEALIEDGNRFFQSRILKEAETLYNKAVTLLNMKVRIIDSLSPEESTQYKELKKRCLSNLIQVLIEKSIKSPDAKPKSLKKALEHCQTVLAMDSKDLKVLYRKGRILLMQKEDKEAEEFLKGCLQSFPNSKEFKYLLSHTQASKIENLKSEKRMCGYIFKNYEKEAQNEEKLRRERIRQEKINEALKRKQTTTEASEEKQDSQEEVMERLEKGFVWDISEYDSLVG